MLVSKSHVAGMVALLAIGLGGAAQPNDDAVGTIMRAKLDHAQKVLEGIALEDYEGIQKHAKKLGTLSQAAAWQVYQTPEYQQHSLQFRKVADELVQEAEAKNLEKTVAAYSKMTNSCVDCHKYVRGVRISQLDLPTFNVAQR